MSSDAQLPWWFLHLHWLFNSKYLIRTVFAEVLIQSILLALMVNTAHSFSRNNPQCQTFVFKHFLGLIIIEAFQASFATWMFIQTSRLIRDNLGIREELLRISIALGMCLMMQIINVASKNGAQDFAVGLFGFNCWQVIEDALSVGYLIYESLLQMGLRTQTSEANVEKRKKELKEEKRSDAEELMEYLTRAIYYPIFLKYLASDFVSHRAHFFGKTLNNIEKAA